MIILIILIILSTDHALEVRLKTALRPVLYIEFRSRRMQFKQ